MQAWASSRGVTIAIATQITWLEIASGSPTSFLYLRLARCAEGDGRQITQKHVEVGSKESAHNVSQGPCGGQQPWSNDGGDHKDMLNCSHAEDHDCTSPQGEDVAQGAPKPRKSGPLAADSERVQDAANKPSNRARSVATALEELFKGDERSKQRRL